jgi:hypothetical protein
MLVSRDKLLQVADATAIYACDGNDAPPWDVQTFAQGCTRRIERAEEYVSRLRFVPRNGVTPATFDVISRHCAHCALAYFPAVQVYVEESWLDTTNVR